MFHRSGARKYFFTLYTRNYLYTNYSGKKDQIFNFFKNPDGRNFIFDRQ